MSVKAHPAIYHPIKPDNKMPLRYQVLYILKMLQKYAAIFFSVESTNTENVQIIPLYPYPSERFHFLLRVSKYLSIYIWAAFLPRVPHQRTPWA